MIYLATVLLIFAVATVIALPLWSADRRQAALAVDPETERLEREKAAALLAIREAQLDQAMGKLSDEDYAALRGFYELRAISAMTKLDGGGAASSATLEASDRCARCDTRFTDDSDFCGRCGSERPSAHL